MTHPTHLDPSELGTKEFWDKYYQNDLDQQQQDRSEIDQDAADDDDTEDTELPDPSDLESWFDDVGAPAKTLEFLTSETFPLSPNYVGGEDQGTQNHQPSVLDLGTGNGSALFALRLEGQYNGRMVGVDYSSQSIELARKLHRQYFPPSNTTANSNTEEKKGENDMTFEILDLVNDTPSTKPWWPVTEGGFDLVLDKGTFDAISLSSTTIMDPTTGNDRRICEFYPAKILDMVRPSGFLLITSCNWTEEEVVSWFTGAQTTSNGTSTAKFVVYDRIKYRVFEFGGRKGQGVASVCFKKIQDNSTSTR